MGQFSQGVAEVGSRQDVEKRQREAKIEDMNDSVHPNKVTLAEVKGRRAR